MNDDTKHESKEKNQELVIAKKGNNFIADVEVKKILTTMPSKQLVPLLNSFEIEEIHLNSKILFKMQETFEGTGDTKKRFLRSDLTVQATYQELIRDVGVEIETSAGGQMPYRQFMYNINNSRLENGIRIIPNGILLYATLKLKRKRGRKIFKFKIPQSKIITANSSEYIDNIVHVMYNYINILQMDFDEFKGKPWEILKLIYLYRYKQDISLISKEKERFEKILEELNRYIKTLNNIQQKVAKNTLYNLILDIEYKCNKYKKYKKEAEIMQTIRLTAADLFRMELNEKMNVEKKEAVEKAVKKAVKKAEAQGKLEGKLEGRIEMLLFLNYTKEKIMELVNITEKELEKIIAKLKSSS